MPLSAKPPLDPFAHQFIRQKVRQLAGLGRRIGYTWRDIENELIANLCHRAQWFDPTRGRWTTFVRVVTDNHAATLAEKWRCCPELVEIPEWEPPDREHNGRTLEEHHELRQDVIETLECLDEKEQRICRSLMANPNVSDAARAEGLSRPALYRRVSAIRSAFEQRDLHRYIQKHRTSPNSPR